jgi:hypothetical protein
MLDRIFEISSSSGVSSSGSVGVGGVESSSAPGVSFLDV